jgi:hypothetical protein
MLNALTEAVAVVQRLTRAAHETDSQRSTRDDRSSRVVPLSPPASALQSPLSAFKSQPSALSSQLSSLSSQLSSLPPQVSTLSLQASVPPPSFCSKKIEQRIPALHTKVVFATKTSVFPQACRQF